MRKSIENNLIPSVNFHLWEPCNMRCKFCFATFQDVKKSILPKGHLPFEQTQQVVEELANFGFSKITFVGGEPTLCPWLHDLVKTAKSKGMTTMLVTNGTRINQEYLNKFEGSLDWIAISIDSLNHDTNFNSGRRKGSKSSISQQEYLQICNLIRANGIRLKINTVVHQLNKMEKMSSFITAAKTERWKVLKVLPISGQNDSCIDEFIINDSEFEFFVENNKIEAADIVVCPENNNAMKGSYVMIDPAGRFFDNVSNSYFYSPKILDVGVEDAYRFVRKDFVKFKDRGGVYKWE